MDNALLVFPHIVYTLRKKQFALPDVSHLIRSTSAIYQLASLWLGTFVWRRAMNCGKQSCAVCLIFIHLLEIVERVLLLMDRILSNYARNTLNIYLE